MDKEEVNLSDLRKQRQDASTAASNQARTYALAGLAIIWLFVSDFFTRKSHLEPSKALLTGGAAFAAALFFDLVQLLGRAMALFFVYKSQENRVGTTSSRSSDDAEITNVGPWPLRVTTLPFYLKFACLLTGYVLVAVYFFSEL